MQICLRSNIRKMTVKETMLAARKTLNLTQGQFAKQLNASQSLISKYESGSVNPPAHIIDECMRIIHEKNINGEISINTLEERLRKVLGGPERANARKAFAVILDSLG